MKTQIFTQSEIEKVKQQLSQGSVIAFPTDTVFGLGVAYDNEDALKRLKHSKLREEHKPIPMMVSSIEQIEEVAIVDERSCRLIHAFMPGSFTIILKKKPSLPSYISNGMDTIAIRMPDSDFVLELLERPMLVTSANLSGETPGKDAHEVLKQLDGRIDGIVLGEARDNVASTIVDATQEEVKILREGIISTEKVYQTLKGEV